MIRTQSKSTKRKGVVLLVVITLLALFAAMGLSFVFYAEGEAQAANLNQQAENKNKVEADPELLLSYFLNQLLTGGKSYNSVKSVAPTGLFSSLRGIDLATNAYGYNYSSPNPSTVPFNGMEKQLFLAPTNLPFPGWSFPAGTTYADLVNFTYYPADGFILDPERMQVRTGPVVAGVPTFGTYPALESTALQGPFVGWNVPYTYSDYNNLFLGAMNASGELLAPSFFRTYPSSAFGFGTMDPSNPKWSITEPYLKYMAARPLPLMHPYFPRGGNPSVPGQVSNGAPLDGGGDVKNLEFGPGLKNPLGGYYANDSIWMDLGHPILTGPDGRKFKPLFAPLIISLDGKINVNACGNIRAAGNVHASNLGLGPWEISLAQFFGSSDLANLFVGKDPGDPNGTGVVFGKYYPPLNIYPPYAAAFLPYSPPVPGTCTNFFAQTQVALQYPPPSSPQPPSPFANLPGSKAPSFQGPLDLDCVTAAFAQTTKFFLPGESNPLNTLPSYFAFQRFPAGWDTYLSSGNASKEVTAHPAMYDWFNPLYVYAGVPALNQRFADSDMEAMYRYRGTGSLSLGSNLFRLCMNPATSLNDPTGHNRLMLTTRSMSFGLPVAAPWIFNPPGTLAAFPTAFPGSYKMPAGAGSSAANPAATAPPYPQASQPWGYPPANTPPANLLGEFGGTSNGNFTGSNGSFNYWPALIKRVNLNRPLTEYPLPSATGFILPASYPQYIQAVLDRQAFAKDIFNVLTQVTIGTTIGSGPGQLSLAPSATLTYPVQPHMSLHYNEYQALIWLAQLAVNIVDFIDRDNYITPFNWNPYDNSFTTNTDPNNPSATINTPNGWVYGTEQPRLVLNEVFAQIDNSPTDMGDPMTGAATKNFIINLWAELHNPCPADPAIPDSLIAGAPGYGVARLEVPGGKPNLPPYRIIATYPTPGGGTPLFTDVQLGMPSFQNMPPAPLPFAGINSYSPTTNAVLQTVAPVLTTAPNSSYSGPIGNAAGTAGNNGFYVIGPNLATIGTPNLFPPTGTGAMVPTITSQFMSYQVPKMTATNMMPNTNLFLQRLLCPDLPWNNDSTNPRYNPYITVDYFTFSTNQLQVNDNRKFTAAGMQVPNAPTTFASLGRRQPFAGGGPPIATGTIPQNPAVQAPVHVGTPPTEPQHTFFRHNAQESLKTFKNNGYKLTNPALAGQTLDIPFNWLVHLDRQVTSPLELLHVSAFPPYQLTQQFRYSWSPSGSSFPIVYGHASLPAWFDNSARIYRALEFFDAGSRATAVDAYGQIPALGGRIAGKVNINEIWDKKQLRALCDSQFAAELSTFTQAQVDQIYAALMQSRSQNATPPGMPTASDRPLKGMASANWQAGYGVEDTFLRPLFGTTWSPASNLTLLNTPVSSRMLSIPPVPGQNANVNMKLTSFTPFQQQAAYLLPPYVQMEPMNKIFNNITCQSNVFAVWLTVGFFDVTDGPLNQANSGKPLTPQSTGANSITLNVAQAGLTATPYVYAGAAEFTITGGSQLGVPWAMQRGCCIWVDNEPMTIKHVSATAVLGVYTITFFKPFVSPLSHGPNSIISMKGVLGGEVGLSEGRNVRHRMFSMVDRSALSIPNILTTTSTQSAVPGSTMPPSVLATQPIKTLPSGKTGTSYGPIRVYVPNGPFNTSIAPIVGGLYSVGGSSGLSATFAGTGTTSNSIILSGTLAGNVNVPTVYFPVTLTNAMTGTTVTQYFKISIGQLGSVSLNGLGGTASVNFPSQLTPAAAPAGSSLALSYPWKIDATKVGMQLLISGNDPVNTSISNQEIITLTGVNTATNTISAYFFNAYQAGAVISLPGQPGAVPNSVLGNPGPQQRFDHRQNTALVPHYSIIQ